MHGLHCLMISSAPQSRCSIAKAPPQHWRRVQSQTAFKCVVALADIVHSLHLKQQAITE